jgi:lambda family phage tail tape measure protein
MPTVSTLTVDLIAKTASFEGPLSKAGDAAKKTAADIKNAFSNMDFGEGKGGLMVLDELLGVHLPRHVTSLIASLPGLQQGFALALPALAAVEIGKAFGELIDKHHALTAALAGQGEQWESITMTALRFADQTKIKLLELQVHIDDITKGPLSTFKEKLALIDAQTLDQLRGEFDTLEKEAKKAFAGMEESAFQAFIFGESGAQKGIKNVGENLELITKHLKDMEKAGNMSGISAYLDTQIAKTKDLIDTDQKWAGTDATPKIIMANERLLHILDDLKAAYQQVTDVQSKRKDQTRIDQTVVNFSFAEKDGGRQMQEQLANLGYLKAAAVDTYTATGMKIDQAKAKADEMFSGAELQAHLDYYDRLIAAGGSFEQHQQAVADKQIFLYKAVTEAENQLAQATSANNALTMSLDEENFKRSKQIADDSTKDQMATASAKTKAMIAVMNMTRAETDEEAQQTALQQVHSFQRIADIQTEIQQLQKLRDAAIQKGQSTLAYDAAIANAHKQRQKDLADELIATGKLGNVFKGTMMQMAEEGKQWQLGLANTFKQTMGGMNSSLAAFVVTGEGNFRQLAITALESFIQLGLGYVESKLLMIAANKLFGSDQSEQATKTIATNAAMALSAAGLSAANTLAFTSALFLPPIPEGLSAAAFATGMTYAGFAAAERGAILPNREMLVNTHPEEMILPQHISNFVVDAASRASGSGGGDTHHHHNIYAPTIQAIDGPSVERMLDQHEDKFAKKMAQIHRRFS